MKSYKKQKPKKTPKQKGGSIPPRLLLPLIPLVGAVAGRLIYNSFKNPKINTLNYPPEQHNKKVFERFEKINAQNEINYGTKLNNDTLVYDSSRPLEKLKEEIAEQHLKELTEYDSNDEFYGDEYKKALERFY